MADIQIDARAKPRPPRKSAARVYWLADLDFTWTGIIDRKTGRKIGTAELTPSELVKFLGYLAVLLVQSAAANLTRRETFRVYFTPDRPRPWHVIWSAVTLAGVRLAPSEREADVVFRFEDKTIGSAAYAHAINGACADISKSRVAALFESVAGYPLRVTPETHVGLAVEKSEANGAHDGRIVQCPSPALPGKTYQLFIDSADADVAYDYRTTIIGRAPLFVLIKTKPAANRFSIHNTSVIFTPLGDVFSEDEIALLTRFAATMQLDWAALDVLRDRATGRIYVVDVNTTDMGPAVDLSLKDRERLKRAITEAFTLMIRKHCD
ncbi:MAG: hypothetical protein ABUL43_02560 [Hyphomicrobium sp.]